MSTSFRQLPASALLVTAILLPFLAAAQTEQPTPGPDPLAGIPIQVLDRQQVDAGDHTITFNRIAPPNLPALPLTPALDAQLPSPASPPGEEKLLRPVSFSVEAQNQLFTEVRVASGAKPPLRVRLNMDFRLFGSVSQVETSEAFYMYITALVADTADAEANFNLDPPDLTASLPAHASYLLTAGNPADHPDALAGLDALCAYFDANRAQLIADYRRRRTETGLALIQPPTPAPAPPDTVINYWPVKSAVYPTH